MLAHYETKTIGDCINVLDGRSIKLHVVPHVEQSLETVHEDRGHIG